MMQTKTILDTLVARANKDETPVRGNLLPNLVHWIAERADDLSAKEMELLMGVGLALYKNELEKNWGVTTDCFDLPRSTANVGSQASMRTSRIDEAMTEMAEAVAAADSARYMDAVLAMRRQPSAGASITRRRRWSDQACWSLTMR